jgi:co-chaperonin GroES (HSP10)
MFISEMILLDDHIMVKRKDVKKKTGSGIIKSDKLIENEQAEEVAQAGLEVLAIGKDVKDVIVGDYVLVMPNSTAIGLTVADFDYPNNVNIIPRSIIYVVIKNLSKKRSDILI